MTGDVLFSGGRIVSLDPRDPRPDAVLVRDGLIAAVGALDDLRRACGPGAELVDLAGQTLVPGFYDAHQHQLYAGLARSGVDARADSIEELVARVREQAARKPAGTWIEGAGYDDSAFAERRPPSRADLDRAAPDHPVLITHTSGHAMAVNGRALAAAGIGPGTGDPDGGRIERTEDGREPSGILHERAMELVRRVLPPPSPDRLETAILAAGAANLRAGVTSVWEPSIEPDHLAAYRRLADAHALPVRVTMAHKRVLRSGEVVPFPEPFRGPWLSSVAVKLFLDGAIAARTAAMSDPYEGEEGERGLLLWPQPELERMVAEIHRAGLVASIHAIGDAAIASAVAAFEAAAAVAPIAARDRIEHCGLPLGDLPARVAACGAVPVLQTPFVRFHGDVYLRRVGPSRGERLYPARTLLAHCPVVAGSSDAPVVPDARPLTGISAAITRRSASGTPVAASEAISFEQALWLYTLGAAAAAGEDARKGSIAPGKLADLTILGADVEAVAPEELDKVPVAAVMVDGRLIVLR